METRKSTTRNSGLLSTGATAYTPLIHVGTVDEAWRCGVVPLAGETTQPKRLTRSAHEPLDGLHDVDLAFF